MPSRPISAVTFTIAKNSKWDIFGLTNCTLYFGERFLEEIPLLSEAANFPFLFLLVYNNLQILCLLTIVIFLTFRIIVITGNIT